MKIAPNLQFAVIEPTKKSLENFVRMIRSVYQNFTTAFNGNIGFGDGANLDNINGSWINVVAPVAPNTDFTMNHNLGRIPSGYWIMQKDRACDVYTGGVAATQTQLTLRASVASAVLRIFVICILISLGFFAKRSEAQGVHHQEIALKATVAAGSSGLSGSVMQPIPSAIITVCNGSVLPITGSTCTGLASIFSDSALTLSLSNPFNADLNGNYGFWITPGSYIISVGGANIVTYSYAITLACGVSSTCVYSGPMTFSGSLTVSGAATFNQLSGTQHVNANQSFAAALAATANPGSIEIDPGTYTVATNTVIPVGIQLVSKSGGMISVANGVTLTINSPIMAPPVQIFTYVGTGAVSLSPVTGTISNVYANWFPGADIDAQTNAAFAACAGTGLTYCGVRIATPGATGYVVGASGATISIPFKNNSALGLLIEPGTQINFNATGNADWLQYFATGAANNNNFFLDMRGAKVVGNASAGNCLHFRQVSTVKTFGAYCTLFTNSSNVAYGNGELDEGTIDVFRDTPIFAANNIGLRETGCINPTCGPGTTSGSANNVVYGGRLQANTVGGHLVDGIGCPAGQCGNSALLNHADDIEGNGTNNPVTTGSLTAANASNIITVTGAGTAQKIFAGTYVIQTGFSNGPCYNGNFLVQAATSNTYTYNCIGGAASATGGSTTGHFYQQMIEQGNNIEYFGNFEQWGSTTGNLAEAIVGDSTLTPVATHFQNVTFSSSTQSTNTIYSATSNGTIVDGSTQEINSPNNFFNCGIGGGTARLQILIPPGNSSAGSLQSGCGGSTAVVNLPGPVSIGSGLAADPAGFAGTYTCYYNTTSNAQKCSYNNGTFFQTPQLIASGTTTLTANAALAAVTSQAVNTTAATNALTTDAIEWSFATAPTAGDNLCHVLAYVTAGNVNFVRTNPTAAAQNVSALVINWRVIR